LDLAPIPNLNRVNAKAEDLITRIEEVHKATVQMLQDSMANYKEVTCCRLYGLYILTKDRFHVGDYNKTVAEKINCSIRSSLRRLIQMVMTNF
jgi:hypothetical protein